MTTPKKRILLLYNGYPRISQSYQYDEAIEINKKYDIMIISWAWIIYTIENNVPKYNVVHPLKIIDKLKLIKFDFIHGSFLNNIPLFFHLSKELNIPFTLRTHSFDLLDNNNQCKYKDIVNSDNCKGIFTFPCFRQKLIDCGYDSEKVFSTFPSFNTKIFKSDIDISNGKNIMGGGAILKKKNIEGFIQLAMKIKEIYPEKTITYYGVQEDEDYYKYIIDYNKQHGEPVIFKTVQHSEMLLEYKKHEWLIYTACDLLKTVGYPLMIAEAQLAGVGVIMYHLRDDLQDYVTDCGYLYKTDDDVLNIIKNDFDLEKRAKGMELVDKYCITKSVDNIIAKWNI